MLNDFWCDHRGPFVDTTGGTVRGYKLDELFIFHGIKYANAKRYELPTPATWDGILDCYTYGPVAPTVQKPSVRPAAALRLDPCFRYNFWPEDEDCQYVNVWTRGLGDGKKRPVMVWVHGGGYSTGSSVEQHSYDPSHLAEENDIVVVSFNHRLNILGFLDMSEYSDKFKDSRNVGMRDIVLVLKWVRDNIEKFGGDPDNVTLFGQSGGGGKIMTLLQIPEAADLFHKVIFQSGLTYPFQDEEKKLRDGKATAKAVMDKLGIEKGEVDKIQSVPFDKLREAYLEVVPDLFDQGISPGCSPCADDWYLGNPITCGFSEKSLKTPMIAGSVEAETYHFEDDFSDYQMSDEAKYERVKSMFGEHTDEMLELFKKAYPGDDILNLYHMDKMFRRGTLDYLDARKKNGGGVSYSYMINYTFHFLGGMPSYHGCDLPMIFHTTDKVICMHEPTPIKLGMQMSKCWATFARTGDPNHEFIGEWKPYDAGEEYTMVFGEENRCVKNFDRELVYKNWEYTPHRSFFGGNRKKQPL